MTKDLVYVGKIISIVPIENADRIESAEVVCGKGGKWKGTIPKGSFKEGDLCHVFLQDTLFDPQDVCSELTFMESSDWRVKMRRFRGVPSEVLIMPQIRIIGKIGDDITEIYNVSKYEKPMPVSMQGDVAGYFPQFIPKTDELNFQRVPEQIEFLRGKKFYSTVKVDGTSCTIFNYKDHFGCCSRTLERKESDTNIVWQIARKYNLKEKLYGLNIALQFETAGPGIQKNRLGLNNPQPFLFNIFNIDTQSYYNANDLFVFAKAINFPTVQIIDYNVDFNFKDDDELRKYAEGKYPNGQQREGIVIRPMEEAVVWRQRVSFKVINLLYKD